MKGDVHGKGEVLHAKSRNSKHLDVKPILNVPEMEWDLSLLVCDDSGIWLSDFTAKLPVSALSFT